VAVGAYDVAAAVVRVGRRRPVVMIAHLKPSPKFELPEIL
jgi:hypothetical protein